MLLTVWPIVRCVCPISVSIEAGLEADLVQEWRPLLATAASATLPSTPQLLSVSGKYLWQIFTVTNVGSDIRGYISPVPYGFP